MGHNYINKREVITEVIKQFKDCGTGEIYLGKLNDKVILILVEDVNLKEYYELKGEVYIKYSDFIHIECDDVNSVLYEDLMEKHKPTKVFSVEEGIDKLE